MSKKSYWFKRRRYGWGWVPITWQGWAVILGYLLIVIAGANMLKGADENTLDKELGVYFLIMILATAALVRFSYKFGPSPKWRWGSKPDDNPDEDY